MPPSRACLSSAVVARGSLSSGLFSLSCPPRRTATTIGSCLLSSALALERGRSTSKLSVSSGAVTMKMINSTSMTSMYGTTLISDLSLRRLRRPMALMADSSRGSVVYAGLALQDGAELVGKGLKTNGHALHARREAVVGPHRRDGHEQADGGSEQRFGNARRDRGDAGLLAAVDHVVHGH